MRSKNKRSRGRQNRNKKKINTKPVAPEDTQFWEMFTQINSAIDKPLDFFSPEQDEFFFFLLSKKWITDFTSYIEGKTPEKPKGDVNSDLLKKVKEPKRFQWKKDSYLNQYLSKNIVCWKDYIPCCEAAWMFLVESYEATPIYRRFTLGLRRFEADFDLPEIVEILFLDESETLDKVITNVQVKKVQYDDDEYFNDFMVKIIEEQFPKKDKNEIDSTFEECLFYKLDSRISSKRMTQDIKDQIKEGFNTVEIRAFEVRSDYEELENVHVYDLFWETSTIIIVRRPPKDQIKYLIYPKQLPIQKDVQEYCEYCDGNDYLLFQCHCQKVFYCSVRCSIKNMGYHSKICLQAKNMQGFLSIGMFPSVPEPVSLLRGLENLGNACYMNSILQCFKMVEPLRNSILNVDDASIKSLINKQAPHETNIVPYISYFMRSICTESDKPYQPYLLKAAVGVNNSEFLKFNQSDAHEYLHNLIELCSDELIFHKKENFFYKYLQGLTNNQNICLSCDRIDSTEEKWTFLALPIPKSTKSKTMLTKYIPLNFDDSVISAIKYKFDPLKDTLQDLIRDFNLDEIKEGKSVFALVDDDQIQKIFYDFSPLISEIEQLMNQGTYSKCSLVCYETLYEHDKLASMIPVSIKCMKIVRSIALTVELESTINYVALFLLESPINKRDLLKFTIKYLSSIVNNGGEGQNFLENQKVIEYDNQLQDLESYQEKMEEYDPLGENNYHNIMLYSDYLMQMYTCTKQRSIIFGRKNNLEKNKIDELSGLLPPSKEFKIKYLNKGKVICQNCGQKSSHKCEIYSSPEFFSYPRQKKVEEENTDNESDSKQKNNKKETEIKPKKDKASELKEDETKENEKIEEGEVESSKYKKIIPIECLLFNSELTSILEKRNFKDLVKSMSVEVPQAKLDHCIESYVSTEELGEDNKVDCDNCKEKTSRSTKVILSQLPEILIIQLKRFKTEVDYIKNKLTEVKNHLLVKFEEELTINDTNYSLRGVVNHFGELKSGHYTSFCYNKERKQWFNFDDSKVSATKFEKVCSKNAYVLIFERVQDLNN